MANREGAGALPCAQIKAFRARSKIWAPKIGGNFIRRQVRVRKDRQLPVMRMRRLQTPAPFVAFAVDGIGLGSLGAALRRRTAMPRGNSVPLDNEPDAIAAVGIRPGQSATGYSSTGRGWDPFEPSILSGQAESGRTG